ncbi:hypothetical protein GGR56DRAFT_565317 [Xylariaceae sp. FL0804]|nr:hypothetical protein GGR56DRAFT_565317 [Xylariaceae sp. FL0804]
MPSPKAHPRVFSHAPSPPSVRLASMNPDPPSTQTLSPPPQPSPLQLPSSNRVSVENHASTPRPSDGDDGRPLSFGRINRMLREPSGMSPRGSRSASASPLRLSMPMVSAGQLAFSAMQFLPVPLIVLNNLKTVVLANEAMGRMLGVPVDSPDGLDEGPTVSDRLRGQTLSQVGIDMLQRGKPVWVSWESFLDGLVVEMSKKQAEEASRSNTDGYLHDPVPSPYGSRATSPGANSGKIASDSAVDVVVVLKNVDRAAIPKSRKSEYQTYAKMIITIWKIDVHQTYFTLTFTNTNSAPARSSESYIPVARPSTLEAVERKSIISTNSPSASSSHDSNSPSYYPSPGSVSVTSSPFPPMGPPSRLPQTSTPSYLQKITIIKDALLDNTEMPILAMWKDGSAPVFNRAARALFEITTGTDSLDGFDLLPKWDVWNEDFTVKYEPSELPISVLLKKQEPFSGWRVGMQRKTPKEKIVYDILGEVITDDQTGEFVGGVVTCRDVTHMAQEITQIKEAEEERFKLICDTMPQMVWTATAEGQVEFWNNRWYDYTGLTPEESLGQGWIRPFHPDDMPETIQGWKHSLATGDQYFTEYRCRSKDGEWRWMLGRALPLKDKQTGKIERWFGTCTDVHETIQAKLAAKQIRGQLLSVLKHAQTTIFSVDRSQKITMLEGALTWDDGDDKDRNAAKAKSNPGSERYIGRDVYEVFNDLSPRLRQGESPAFLKPVKKMLAGEDPKDTVHEHQIEKHFFRTRFLPLRENKSKDGQHSNSAIQGVIGVIMDVTELKEREQDLKQQVREKRLLKANEAAAKEASRLKSQFLANMSHEIRTPITGVIGMAELLLDMSLGDEQREYAENVSRSANALLTVINDILDFSKIESGRLDIEEVQFSLSVVVLDVSKMLSFAAERKNLDFRSDIAPDIENDLVVLGDPGRVRQIITNLLTNSIKFTTSGYVKFSVWKEKETNDAIEIRFVVEDTGIGIEEEIRKRLFQPFSQGDPSTARRFGGTGLGLTISKNLLDLMRGRITMESSVGHGTTATFWITFNKPQSTERSSLVETGLLPDRLQSEMSVSCNSSEHDHYLGTPPGEMLHGAFDKTKRPRRQRSINLPPRLVLDNEDIAMADRSKIQVLVVEDNAINQQIATKTIKKLGFGVSAAWNGKEALEYLEASKEGRHSKPDIILMDVQMPIIDGYRCTHILRHHIPYRAYTSDIPIVAMTASAIQGDKEKCTKAGMDDYLAKPVRGQALERMLLRWGRHRRRPPPPNTPLGQQSVSDCSEMAEHCYSTDIPTFGLAASIIAETPEEHSSASDTDRKEDIPLNLLTPRPLAAKDGGAREPDNFPFGATPARQLNSDELAMQLRDDKLLDAAGGAKNATKSAAQTMMQGALPEGDSLTEENVEKLERQVSASSTRRGSLCR